MATSPPGEGMRLGRAVSDMAVLPMASSTIKPRVPWLSNDMVCLPDRWLGPILPKRSEGIQAQACAAARAEPHSGGSDSPRQAGSATLIRMHPTIDPACHAAAAALESDPFYRCITAEFASDDARRRAALSGYLDYSIAQGIRIGRV